MIKPNRTSKYRYVTVLRFDFVRDIRRDKKRFFTVNQNITNTYTCLARFLPENISSSSGRARIPLLMTVLANLFNNHLDLNRQSNAKIKSPLFRCQKILLKWRCITWPSMNINHKAPCCVNTHALWHMQIETHLTCAVTIFLEVLSASIFNLKYFKNMPPSDYHRV